MGYWWLKPKEELDAWDCFEISEEDVLDFITYDVKKGYEISDVDKEHIYGLIKQGCVEGEVNDWDSE